MRSTIFLPLLFSAATVLHSSLSFAAADDDLLHKTCKDSANRSPNVSYDFCVTSLQVFPDIGDPSVKVKELAGAAALLAMVNATSTRAKIADELLKTSNGSRLLKEVLETCLSVYTNLFADAGLQDAIDAIRSSRYGDAQTYLSAALKTPSNCEDSFAKRGIKSLLAKENEDSKGLIAISLAITAGLNK